MVEQVQAEKDSLRTELKSQMAGMQRQHDAMAAELHSRLQWCAFCLISPSACYLNLQSSCRTAQQNAMVRVFSSVTMCMLCKSPVSFHSQDPFHDWPVLFGDFMPDPLYNVHIETHCSFHVGALLGKP